MERYIHIILVLLLGFTQSGLIAQEFRDPEEDRLHWEKVIESEDTVLTPHGGLLQKSGGFYIEYISDFPEIKVFVYDERMRKIGNKNIPVFATFYLSGSNKKIKRQLTFNTDQSFEMKNVPKDYDKCIVFSPRPSLNFQTEFKPLKEPFIIYTCSFHSDIERKKPGECPKCGAILVEKKEYVQLKK